MDIEFWKTIPGYEGLYKASTQGRVKSLDRESTYNGITKNLKGKVLKTRKATQDRLYVDLHKDRKIKRFYIHELVALTFISERPKGYDICHINGNNQDNRLENLRYDTRSQNQIDIYRQGKKHGLGKLSLKQVIEIRQLYATGEYTHYELAKKYNVSKNTTQRVVKRKSFSWLNDDGTIEKSKTEIV